MSRKRKRFNTSVNPDILEEFRELSEETRIPMSKLMDEALNDLLEKYEKE